MLPLRNYATSRMAHDPYLTTCVLRNDVLFPPTQPHSPLPRLCMRSPMNGNALHEAKAHECADKK
ncbi:MAG: hypothetical protein AMXMBFR16_01710 [Candidatus Uhrbacteria bacterium]